MPNLSVSKRFQRDAASSDEDSDDAEFEGRGKGPHVDEEFETNNSHSGLINSLDVLIKTNKKRVQKETEVSGVKPTSLGLCQAVASGQEGDAEEWLTLGKVLGGVQDKSLKAKSVSSLASSKKSKKTKEKTLSLTTSLEKPVVQRIQRAILYDHVKKDVSKWNSVVYHNRLAEQLVFPLEAGKKLRKPTAKDASQDFVPQTPLEVEIAKILHGPEYVERKQAEIFGKAEVESEAGVYVKNIEEALEKHSELSRLRALQSYEMAKAKRRNKIKSKKYHRLLRRDKIRKQLKEFEELQEKDPEAAMIKLEELDKARVQERMSLKHRNTSKWAKMQAVRAKYNRESRVALSEQLKISRELTVKVAESSDDEDDLDLDVPDLLKNSLNNPWFANPADAEKEKMELYYTGYKKLWSEINAKKERDSKREEAEVERQRAEVPKPALEVAPQPKQKKLRNQLRKEASKRLKAEKRRKLVEESEANTPDPALDSVVQVQGKVVQPQPEVESIPLSPELVGDLDQESNEDDELTEGALNNLLSRAHDRIVQKATTQLKALTPASEPQKPSLKRKKDREVRSRPRVKRNKDGDIDEIRDLTVDDTEINFEGGVEDNSTVDLVSVRQREASSISRRIEELDSVPKTPAKPVSLINVADYLQIGKGPKFNMSEVHAEQAELDDDEYQIQNIAEAFEDDDVIAEFQKQKEEIVEAGKPKDVDLSLPGWGEWGGKDLKPSKRKKNRFVLKAPAKAPRKDAHLSHVILNEDGSAKLKAHQVRQLPFPYSRVKDFEKMVRAPVGRTWLPEKAMKSLTAPKIITRLGAVIQPISEDALMKKSETSRSLKLAGIKAGK